ncbi:hypothetical protein ACTXPO_13525 [Psychrobacter celer]|uniref:hypothetical protein n=1 Tax=Psychrobacter TaxID=497 RepID=UPI000C2AA2C5|nr:hypothetical protein [Psychrobacter sp. L7]PJX20100.1 hypothetical protein CAP50_12430 [Psychrobacter sp. L7]
MLSIKQKIARMEDEIARLKVKERKLENGQKIIIGGMMLSMAKDSSIVASKLLEWIEKEVTRKTDLDRLSSVIEELKKQSKPLEDSNKET